jgi:uncharacterized protein YeaO (DUF488 family)
MSVECKRAYEKPGSRDGYRVLVDGLWPRGIKKEDLRIDQWMRAIAPSTKLRKWYGHEPEKWEGFRKRYRRELSASPRDGLLDELVNRARKGRLTLVFGARAPERSNAAVIEELIVEQLSEK